MLVSSSFALEDGPPPLPLICKDLAEKNLKPGKFSPLERARAAFVTGFWIRIALDTCTHFRDDHSLKALSPAQWVVFRGAPGGLPLRSTRQSDCQKPLWEEADSILVSAASATELHIICAFRYRSGFNREINDQACCSKRPFYVGAEPIP